MACAPRAFADELFVHTMAVPAAAWRAWTASEMFLDALRARAADAGIGRRVIDAVVSEAADAAGWQPLAALDATLRMVERRPPARAGSAAATPSAR